MQQVRKNGAQMPASPFSRLTAEQCGLIHQASLEILERAGARLYETEFSLGRGERGKGGGCAGGDRGRAHPALRGGGGWTWATWNPD